MNYFFKHRLHLTLLITQISEQVNIWCQRWSSALSICSEAWYGLNSIFKRKIVLNEYKILHETIYYTKFIKRSFDFFQNTLILLVLLAPYHSGYLKANISRNEQYAHKGMAHDDMWNYHSSTRTCLSVLLGLKQVSNFKPLNGLGAYPHTEL